MIWEDFWLGVAAGAISVGLISVTLICVYGASAKSECSRWNNGALCELAWVPKGETK